MAEDKVKWTTTCNRFVAFLDIMGFKNMVFNNDHYVVLNLLKRLQLAIDLVKQREKERSQGDDLSSFLNYATKSRTETITFSDSILLISNDNSLDSAKSILFWVMSIIFQAMRCEIPITGSIAYGLQTSDIGYNIHFGKPLIDAFDFQHKLEFYGVVLHQSMEKYLVEKEMLNDLTLELTNYAIPMKQESENHYLVNWVNYDLEKRAVSLVECFYKKVPIDKRYFIDNTLEFVKWAIPKTTLG